MGSANVSKIERVGATRNSTIWVDLCLDKRSGRFFAHVGDARIEAATKDEAVRMVRAALDQVTAVVWREVILVRVRAPQQGEDDEDGGGGAARSTENGRPVYTSSCSFTYLRRERAAHPLRPNQTVEREHREDFERRIAERRKYEAQFERDRTQRRRRSDAEEQAMRSERAAFSDMRDVWDHYGNGVTEYELPYSAEAWAGVERIAQTLREAQATLDAFARSATAERYAALAGASDVFRQLGPGAPRPARKRSGP
jgi:hypothetical protein